MKVFLKYICTFKKKAVPLHRQLKINNKNYTKMKSLKKFICSVAKVEILMVDKIEEKECLYIVRETPKSKKATWQEEEYRYWHHREAIQKFIELILFWCR